MSIEQTLERIAISAERSELLLSKILESLDNAPAQVPAPIPAAPAPAPMPAAAPAPIPVPPAAPAPAPAPAPMPPAAGALPFHDTKTLVGYCMEKYRTLGPIRGGMIQNVLNEMGCANANAVPAERYAEFFAKVEAL